MRCLVRAVVDAVCGAIIVSVVAVGVVGLLALLAISLDSANSGIHLQRLPYDLRLAAIAGMVLGALAGLSTRLTNGRVSFIRNVTVIGTIAIAVRLFIFPTHKGANLFLSDLATAIAAIIAAILVVVWSRIQQRASTDTEGDSHSSTP
jgi:hypothetical protein